MAASALSSTQVAVGASATLLAGPGVARHVLVRNDGAADVFLGPSSVTTSGATGGLRVSTNTTLPVPVYLPGGASLYAISATSSTVAVLDVVP